MSQGIPSVLVPLALRAGIAPKEDALLTEKPTALTNVRVNRTGSFDPRFGFDAIGKYNLRHDTSTPPEAELLVPDGDRLLRIGNGQVDEFLPLTSSDCEYRGRVPEAIARPLPYATSLPFETTSVRQAPDIAYSSTYGYVATVYLVITATTYDVCIDLVSTTGGARVFSQYPVESNSNTKSNPRVAINGAFVAVFWYDATAGKVRGRTLNLNSLSSTISAWNSALDVATTSFGTFEIDADTITGTGFVMAYWTSTPNFTVSQMSAGLIIATSRTVQAIGGPEGCSIQSVAGERYWVAYSYESGGLAVVRAVSLDSSLAIEAGPQDLESYSASPLNVQVSIARLDASHAYIAWSGRDSAALKWCSVVRSSSTLTASSLTTVPGAALLSDVFVRTDSPSNRAYAWIVNRSDQTGDQFLVDLNPDGAGGLVLRPVARALVGGLNVTRGRTIRSSSVSSVANIGTDQWALVTLADNAAAGDTTSVAIQAVQLLFGKQWARGWTSTPQGIVLGGGWPHVVDESRLWEVGFAHPPCAADATVASSATAGSLVAASSYSYKFVYVARHGRGHVHSSAPSLSVSVTISGGHSSANVSAPCLHITGRSDGTVRSPVSIEVYRTVAGGSVFYYVTTLTNVPGSTTTGAYNDGLSDATLQTRRKLYTTGNVLEHIAPESAALVTTYRNAVVAGDTHSGAVWISGEMLADEGAWFNDTLVFGATADGRVTMLVGLDAALVVGRPTALALVTGDAPNDLGNVSLSPLQRLQTDVGCDDPMSVVAAPEGVFFFSSTAGLALLDRGFSVQQIGRLLQGQYPSATAGRYFAGAVLSAAQHSIRWLSYQGSQALRLDYYHSQVYQAPVWTTDVLAAPNVPSATATIAAACEWKGALVYITATGILYREKDTTATAPWLDTSGATDQWFTRTTTAAVEKSFGTQGFHRARRVHVAWREVEPSAVTLTLTSDLGTQVRSWTTAEVLAVVNSGRVHLEEHVQLQKVQWLSVSISETDPGQAAWGTGFGMSLRDITLELAPKTRGPRRSALERK